MENTQKGLLLVISGPSGVGKGTVCRQLMDRNDAIRLSVSATTRSKRPGEVEGKHYYFKTREEFERMIQENAFLEYTQVFGMNYYGTPAAGVELQRSQGYDVILEIDVQGARNVRKLCPDAVTIFIAPPSSKILKERLVGRGTESEEAVQKRFATAEQEMKGMGEYDYIVVNDVLEDAVDDVEHVIKAERCRTCRNQEQINNFLEGWNKL